MPRGVNWPKRGRLPVAVVFGEPMLPSDGESAEDFSHRLTETVRHLHESVETVPARAAAQRRTS